MIISVFADASYDAPTHCGAWGVYIRSSLHHWKGSGVLQRGGDGQLKDNIEAEMQAAAVGIWQALKVAAPGDKLLVQTDCLAAIQHFDGKVERPDEVYDRIVVKVLGWLDKAKVTVEWRHVRGHNVGDGTPRSWVNGWCDRAAREAMREARDKGRQRQNGKGERDGKGRDIETCTTQDGGQVAGTVGQE